MPATHVGTGKQGARTHMIVCRSQYSSPRQRTEAHGSEVVSSGRGPLGAGRSAEADGGASADGTRESSAEAGAVTTSDGGGVDFPLQSTVAPPTSVNVRRMAMGVRRMARS